MTLTGSKLENKTLAFDFSHHGQVRDGETLSNPRVYSSPTGQLVFGTPEVLPVIFRDSNGKKIAIGKGVRVRVDGTNATAGTTYTIVCRVDTSGGDTIEELHNYSVTPTIP